MLWVYEGQTEFWGRVLAARAGLRTTQQTLDKLALDAALTPIEVAASGRRLPDSTLDVSCVCPHAVTWRDWQRREDYYPEGVLLWLDVDARLRDLTQNKVGVDQFAQQFFATHGSVERISTYSFQDVCDTLNKLARLKFGDQRHSRLAKAAVPCMNIHVHDQVAVIQLLRVCGEVISGRLFSPSSRCSRRPPPGES